MVAPKKPLTPEDIAWMNEPGRTWVEKAGRFPDLAFPGGLVPLLILDKLTEIEDLLRRVIANGGRR